jgi:hypothetical protein
MLENEDWRERDAFAGEVKLAKTLPMSTADTGCNNSSTGGLARGMEFAMNIHCPGAFRKMNSIERRRCRRKLESRLKQAPLH